MSTQDAVAEFTEKILTTGHRSVEIQREFDADGDESENLCLLKPLRTHTGKPVFTVAEAVKKIGIHGKSTD